ncbi:diguanylate cyclase [Marinomonas profundi]|nr:diguanylate cyclase [Marinomonas profundi]
MNKFIGITILKHHRKEEALQRLNKCIDEVQAMAIVCNRNDKRVVTISAGVASMIPKEDSNFESLFATADEALYLAKHKGKNQVKWKSVHKDLL